MVGIARLLFLFRRHFGHHQRRRFARRGDPSVALLACQPKHQRWSTGPGRPACLSASGSLAICLVPGKPSAPFGLPDRMSLPQVRKTRHRLRCGGAAVLLVGVGHVGPARVMRSILDRPFAVNHQTTRVSRFLECPGERPERAEYARSDIPSMTPPFSISALVLLGIQLIALARGASLGAGELCNSPLETTS